MHLAWEDAHAYCCQATTSVFGGVHRIRGFTLLRQVRRGEQMHEKDDWPCRVWLPNNVFSTAGFCSAGSLCSENPLLCFSAPVVVWPSMVKIAQLGGYAATARDP